MKYLQKFRGFDQIFEATFTDDKYGVNYTPNEKGKSLLQTGGIQSINTFEFTSDRPVVGDKILRIKSSSFSVEIWNGSTDYFFYKTGISEIPFAIAAIGSFSTVVVQKERIGSSKRGDYFRETAFIIILSQRIWETTGKKIPVYGKNEQIVFEYHGDKQEEETKSQGQTQSQVQVQPEDKNPKSSYVITGEDKKAFDDWCKNDNLYQSAIEQADQLIKWMGSSINRVFGFYKNSTDLILNFEAEDLIKEEIEFFEMVTKDSELALDSQEIFVIPKKTSIAKWNPSDMWICYNGYERGFSDPKFWLKYNDSLSQFNEFFRQSILDKTGIVGVSLKQQITADRRYALPVNIKNYEASQSLVGVDADNSVKTVSISYKYSISSRSGFGQIQFRTFDTGVKSSLGVEVKGSLQSEHMSGKAGALIKYLVPKKIEDNLNFIKKEVDILKIAEKFFPSLVNLPGEDYKFFDQELKQVFLNDLEYKKNGTSNSRLQAVMLVDWIISRDKNVQNRIIRDIIRFAKSESDWSSPHIILK